MMIQLPGHLVVNYQIYCRRCGISDTDFVDYLKWLRFFLDFCEKYHVTGEDSQRISLFADKLKEEKQGEAQRLRACRAVSLYFEMIMGGDDTRPAVTLLPPLESIKAPTGEAVVAPAPVNSVRKSFYTEAGYQEKSSSPEWDEVIAKLAAEIKVRHYSRKTLKTYALWSRKFQHFLKNKPPVELGSEDVKAYLTHLAVDCHVAASTQNQAFYIG